MNSASEWNQVINALSDAVCLLDKEHIILRCNAAMTRLANLPESRIVGRHCWEVVHGIQEPLPECPVLRMEKSLRRESQEINLNGKWFLITVDPILNEKGGLEQTVHIVRDITANKETEGKLRQSVENIRALIDNAPYGAHLYRLTPDKQLVFIGANKSADIILNVNNQQFIGKTIEEAFPNLIGTEIPDAYRAVAATGKPFNTEQIYSDNLGIAGAFEVCAFQTTRDHVAALFRDITEKQKMLETVQQMQKLDSLGILAGGIAHDFNNLLGGIFGHIDLALHKRGLEAQTAGYLSAAMNTLSRAKNLTQQLLTFAKGGVPVRKSGSLEKVIKEGAFFTLSGSNITCNFKAQENLFACEFDENQISQVIDNIVLNAQQAMPMGGAVDISIQNFPVSEGAHNLLKPGNYVKITVRDSGIGIPREILGRIFDPFFTTKQQGHGLGLATAYSIVRKHEGCIDVESMPGKGTTFYIYLPALQSMSAALVLESSELQTGSGRILVMDDESFIRETTSEMLEHLGYTPVCVKNGNEALAQIARDKAAGLAFAAMILDLTVPGGMGGKELIPKIREQDTTIPVIVTSGYSEDPILAKPRTFGFSAGIAKPFTTIELGRLLGSLLK
jgi:PAS domain S-box-containing protein